MKLNTKILTVGLSFVLTLNVNAQSFEMLKDINPNGSSKPYGLEELNGKLIFNANDGVHGHELWITDGTEAGTQMVKDLNPTGSSGPIIPVKYNDKLYFVASDGTNGAELWATDGTDAGTQMVKDINPTGSGLISTRVFTEFNGKLYFNADDGINGDELWVTDGTSAGTQMLKDINASGNSNPGKAYWFFGMFTEYNNKLYFSANDGINGVELWVTDGTTAGTLMLKDINTSGDSNPGRIANLTHRNTITFRNFTEFNGKLYFSANDGIKGDELWVTDGTTAGTQMLKDIRPGGLGGAPCEFTEYNGKLFFNANDGTNGAELWVTDGTTAGTQMLIDINSSGDSDPFGFTEYNGKLYFSADDGSKGSELWITDGTSAGTQMVKDINSTDLTGGSFPSYFIEYNGKLYFSADSGTNGFELWVTDGTEANTMMIQPDIAPASDPLYPYKYVFDGSLYIVGHYNGNGEELWKVTSTSSLVTEELINVTLYPNPVSDDFYIKTTETVEEVSLYSVAGQKLRTWKNQNNFNVSEFSEGIYFVKISTLKGDKTMKIVKK